VVFNIIFLNSFNELLSKAEILAFFNFEEQTFFYSAAGGIILLL
jgi:hypothetical protein